MPHEKTGLDSRTPWLPRPAGTPRQGSRQGPAKGPAPTSLPLEWISTSTGTLGPLFGEKERQRGDSEAGGRREQKKRQMFFPGSRGPSRLSASQDPLQRIRFEQWDPHGTLPGTPCECALRVPKKPAGEGNDAAAAQRESSSVHTRRKQAGAAHPHRCRHPQSPRAASPGAANPTEARHG